MTGDDVRRRIQDAVTQPESREADTVLRLWAAIDILAELADKVEALERTVAPHCRHCREPLPNDHCHSCPYCGRPNPLESMP